MAATATETGLQHYAPLMAQFGIEEFRSPQKQIIDAALNQDDILVFLPTGHGKSLTFQFPAYAKGSGCTIVISPLLALMDNQATALQARGLAARALNSLTSIRDRTALLAELVRGDLRTRLLYVSPEQFCATTFLRVVDILHSRGQLNRVVIDEAHCAIEWGRQFRREYAQLGFVKTKYPDVPITALTGTASDSMQREITATLNLEQSHTLRVFRESSNRPNIHYEVRYIEDMSERVDDLIAVLSRYRGRVESVYGPPRRTAPYQGCGLVYCRRRAATEQLAAALTQAGIPAHPYHAHLDPATKDRVMSRWIAGDPDYGVVVATVAFGMGIDKPNARFVIHFELPDNIEALAQQAGRGGRDNKAAMSLVYYSRRDRNLGVHLAKQAKDANVMASTRALITYCENTSSCRHLRLASYFDKEVPRTPTQDWCMWACDICKDAQAVARSYRRWEEEFDYSD